MPEMQRDKICTGSSSWAERKRKKLRLLKEFTRQTSRKDYECASCRKKILVGLEYISLGKHLKNRKTHATLHIECYYWELGFEFGKHFS